MNFRRIGQPLVCGFSVFAMFTALGCTDLPELAENDCGNYVIDPEEDCDSIAVEGSHCAGSGEENACHYTCGDVKTKCPEGYGCGFDDVCRRHSGVFELQGQPEGYVWPTTLSTGDFDSDGNGDLLLLGATDVFGHRSARGFYSNDFSLHAGLSLLPVELANPAIGSDTIGGPGTSIAFADIDGVAILRGYPDRSTDFAVFPTISLPPATHARIVMLDCLPSRAGDELIALLTSSNGSSRLVGLDYGSDKPMDNPIVELTPVSGGEVDLLERQGIQSIHFDEASPCAQIVLGYRGKSNIEIFTPCKDTSGTTTWNGTGKVLTVNMPNGVKVDKGIIGTDVDLDGHLDLLIGANGGMYVAYGLGNGQFTSQKANGTMNEAASYSLPFDSGGMFGFPLAIADLNLDSIDDYVLDSGIMISRNGGYTLAYDNRGAPWTDALVANFNANNLPDVATVVDGTLDIEFLNNVGDGAFGLATLPTDGLPGHLGVGDFDGDLLNDIVFGETITDRGNVAEHLAFAFGSPYGPPELPVATGEVGKIGQIFEGKVGGPTGVDPMSEVALVIEGEGGRADSIALLPGRASRAIYSTLPLRMGQSLRYPVSMAFGHFGDSTPDLAALTADPSNHLTLFRIETVEERLAVPSPSDELPAGFMPVENGMPKKLSLRYGAKVIASNLDGNETDEALVVGAYEDLVQGAFALNVYDNEAAKFKLTDQQSFAGTVTNDSIIFVDDIDGDGKQDIILTTGTLDSPQELLIVWGNKSSKLPDLSQFENVARIKIYDSGVRAVTAIRSPNGSGKLIIASTMTSTYMLEFDSKREWTPIEIPKLGSARALATIDFDRDGVEDLVVQTEAGLGLYRSVPK